MGDMTRNFSRAEFRCKDQCGADHINMMLVQILQAVRDHFGVPVTVSSGVRCARRNKKVGGAKHSQHLLGNAADIQVAGVAPKTVAAFAASLMPGWGGVKPYATFTHVDIRPNMWRG